MSKPIVAINRYKADLREFGFLIFEQFHLDELLGKAPYEAWGVDECKSTLDACYRWAREVSGPLNALTARCLYRIGLAQIMARCTLAGS